VNIYQSQGKLGDLRFSRWWRWMQQGPPKRWYPTATLHGVTTQKTTSIN